MDWASEQLNNLQAEWKEVHTRRNQDQANEAALSDWSPPPSNFIKCNVDATVSREGAGYDIVLRNHEGTFVAAKCNRLIGEEDPFMAEILGVKEALTWIKTQAFNNIMLESDCLNFCTAFNSCFSDFSYAGLVVKQCKSIATDIGNVSVSHIKRSANRVTHELARATVSRAVSGVWTGVPPDYSVMKISPFSIRPSFILFRYFRFLHETSLQVVVRTSTECLESRIAIEASARNNRLFASFASAALSVASASADSVHALFQTGTT
ncbi:PREDICTED: uncharacterized protein LOC109176854 [Ipomoea nil]|uniref:uncharacterized protein LOC109176854 n=1 Tax=Ipomoea nil TaxID=35883 RepID=UPI000901337F|nr:PREDICTED: uncharacterized protein LOC109176854 [Ipomoea nil]